MTKLRSVILGCGPRGQAHARVYPNVRRGELVACCDINRQRLEDFGRRFDIKAQYTDLQAMMEEVKPDLLHIVTAPAVRWSVVEAALRTPPRAILIEKPLACRPDEARRMVDACRDSGVALFVNHQLRHHEPHMQLREAVLSGDLGEIEGVRASCKLNLLNQGTHLFDLVSFLFDDRPVDWVFAQAEGAEGFLDGHPCAAYVAGVFAFGEGPHVAFECGAPAPFWKNESGISWNFGIEVVGSKGRAGASLNHGWWLQTGTKARDYPVPYPEENERAQARLTETILEAILEGPERVSAHPNSPERSAASFHVAMAAQLSALERARVKPGPGAVTDADVDRLRAELERARRA